jgi:hypothetical protein
VADPVGGVDRERVRRLLQVVEVRLEVPRRLPRRAAVAAQVEGDDAVPVGEPRRDAGEAVRPGVDAVEADDGRCLGVAPLEVPQDRYGSPSSPLPDGR